MPETTKLAIRHKKDRTPTQSFQQVIQELLKLHQAEKLSNSQLEALLVYACSLFVERELDRRVQEVISDQLSLARLLEAF